MINKQKSKMWVKVVAWVLAISFGLGMTIMFAIPGPGESPSSDTSASETNSPVENPASVADTATADNTEAIVGQGDLASKNGNIDQAVDFYKDAYEVDDNDQTIREKLANAYFALGRQAQNSDTTKAKDAFENYLKLLPDGTQAADAKTALEDL